MLRSTRKAGRGAAPSLNAKSSAQECRKAQLSRTLACLVTLSGLVVLFASAGCTTSCTTQTCDKFHPPIGLPPLVEKDPRVAFNPEMVPPVDPASVLDPHRPERYISLEEALALALENGTVGLQSLANPGLVSEDLGTFGGTGVVGSDAVRVLALAPALVGSNLEEALSRFDPIWSTSMQWRRNDQPVQGFASFQNGELATFSSSIAKPLSTGGTAGVTFTTDYQLLTNPPQGAFGVVNPSYQPRLTFGFEQPLLRGFGTDINQLTSGTPGSVLFPSINSRLGAATQEGILITRLRFDQQRAEFERSVNFLVLNVESAYWRLYGSYVNLYAAEEGLRLAQATWAQAYQKERLGAFRPDQLALARATFEQFRADRTTALGRVIDNERTLRTLLGLQVEDGTRLVPANVPTKTPYQPYWPAALHDCLTLRPELLVARKDVEARQKQLLVQQNSLLPDLRFTADYSSLGLGNRLDGPGTGPNGSFGNALRVLTGNHYNNWTLGLALNVPIGFRAENANVRQARIQLAQSFQALKDFERRAQNILARQYSRVLETSKLIEIRKEAREQFETEVRVRLKRTTGGLETLEFLLDAQRNLSNAITQEAQAIVDYNIALASFDFARGTILERNKVKIAEGPLPFCADVRAAEHEREKTKALILRERARTPLADPEVDVKPSPLPLATAPSVPELLLQSRSVPLDLEGARRAGPLGVKDAPRESNPAKAGTTDAVIAAPLPLGPATKELAEPARLTAPVASDALPMAPALPDGPALTAPLTTAPPALGSPTDVEKR